MRPPSQAAEIARRLAARAEDVCCHYLSNGRREGRYWRVGDVGNTPGRSLFVRLRSTGRGAIGNWQDAAAGQHGDLLDLIALTRGLDMREALDEARAFLRLPMRRARQEPHAPAPSGSPDAARRLFSMSRPIAGTLAETYLKNRRILHLHDLAPLRFHPRCYYRAYEGAPFQTRPALIAAVTDNDGRITGVQRTWLARSGKAKAPIAEPRRSLGSLLGRGVRFGAAGAITAAGEGIETMLSLRSVLCMPTIAALSASNLGALIFPPGLLRLYIAVDDDRSGRRALAVLSERARAAGIEALPLHPLKDDFNGDLRAVSVDKLRASLLAQLRSEDAACFLDP